MNYDEAVKFCEDHVCTECPVYILDIEKRTLEEKQNLHVSCCRNLVCDEDVDNWLENRKKLEEITKEIIETAKNQTYKFDGHPDFKTTADAYYHAYGSRVVIEINIK